MIKENLSIIEYEEKKTSAGKMYCRFNTNEKGWVSCFDLKVIEELKSNAGKIVEVEIIEKESEDGQKVFTNIRKVIKVVNTTVNKNEDIKNPQEVKRTNIATTMYTSYAKDIFCGMLQVESAQEIPNEMLMEAAIKLVKQAKKAFE